jgi:hypothetical protein
MSRTRGALAVAAVVAAATVGGVYVTREATATADAAASSDASSGDASSGEASTGESSGHGAGARDGSADGAQATAKGSETAKPTPKVAPKLPPNPRSGQTVATDAPVVVTTDEVPVVVTFYGWNAAAEQVQVGGYVSGVVEEGGTCTLTLTQDGETVAARGSATADAATTACGELDIAGDQLSEGTWQAVLRYESPSHTGAADAVDIEVTR